MKQADHIGVWIVWEFHELLEFCLYFRSFSKNTKIYLESYDGVEFYRRTSTVSWKLCFTYCIRCYAKWGWHGSNVMFETIRFMVLFLTLCQDFLLKEIVSHWIRIRCKITLAVRTKLLNSSFKIQSNFQNFQETYRRNFGNWQQWT